MQFTKWHGLGNDFILLETKPDSLPKDKIPSFTRRLCDRNFGVGGDGLVFVFQDEQGMINMRIFNADGSEAEMCGNAIRCVAKYAYQKGLAKEIIFQIKTKAGVKVPELILEEGSVAAVKVDMGEPILEREKIPVAGEPGDRVVNEVIEVGDNILKFTAVSMGNPHCLIFVPDAGSAPVRTLGPRLECHRLFPSRTNVEFVEVLNRKEARVRVWERGVGETLACGTGACATAVGGALAGYLDRKVRVYLPGGELLVEWAENNHVYMTGPAEEVFQGYLHDEFIKRILDENPEPQANGSNR
ncbi:MAG: Diaminopimelate epimerase [Thermacetogenium phaeum]|uniref:Diaminopimelate epimerase n=1 Tax=Thermacetogenium phaeum TaxID=85874 RepID=A0A117LAZ4_9THEO|nr:MAG: Diaminopimelate epimerase [Thermacetogenium phaeum]